MRPLLLLVVLSILAPPLATALELPLDAAAPQPRLPRPHTVEWDCADGNAVEDATRECVKRFSSRDHFFGSPQVAMDPSNADRWVIVALSGKTGAGPNPFSRIGQPFVYIAATDAGVTYLDPVFIPPPTPQTYGESISVAIDDTGRVVVAAVWATPVGTTSFEYSLVTWKLASPTDTAPLQRAGTPMPTWVSSAEIRAAHVAHAGNGTFGLVWEEFGTAPDNRSTLGSSSWVRGARTNGDPSTPWTAAPGPITAGPCSSLPRPASWRGTFYISCTAEEGFPENVTVELVPGLWYYMEVVPGMAVVHSFTLHNLTHAFRTRVPALGVSHIAVLEHGRLSVATLRELGQDRVTLGLTSFQLDQNWTVRALRQAGTFAHKLVGQPFTRAGVTAYGDYGGGFVFIYQERHMPPESDVPVFPPPPRMAKWAIETGERSELWDPFDPNNNIPPPTDLEVDQFETRVKRNPLAHDAPIPADRYDGFDRVATRAVLAYGDAGTLVVGEITAMPAPVAVNIALGNGPPSAPLATLAPPTFTVFFIAAMGLVAAGGAARILIGRVKLKADEAEIGENAP